MENTNTNNRKSRLILKNITSDQKKMLLTGSLGISAFATGLGLSTLKPAPNETPVAINDNVECEDICVETTVPFSENDFDSVSFTEAFSAARQELGKGGFFEWQGQTYNTYLKSEWDQLSEQEKEDYFASIDAQTDYTNPETFKPESQTPEVSPADDDSLVATDTEIDSIRFADTNQDGYADTMYVDINSDMHADAIYHIAEDEEVLVLDTDLDNIYDQIIISKFDENFDVVYDQVDEENIQVVDMNDLMTPEETEIYNESTSSGLVSPDEDNDIADDHVFHTI